MSGRKNFLKYQNITAGDMSADVTSTVTNIERLDNIGVQVSWTGTPTGSFSVQVSADYAQDIYGNVTNAGHWDPITLSPGIAAAGSADSGYVDMAGLSSPWIRVVYTHASSSGTLTGYIVGKMI